MEVLVCQPLYGREGYNERGMGGSTPGIRLTWLSAVCDFVSCSPQFAELLVFRHL